MEIAALVLAGVAALLAAPTAFYVARSRPIELERGFRALSKAQDETTAAFERLREEFLQTRNNLASYLEGLEDLEERLDRSRKKLAGERAQAERRVKSGGRRGRNGAAAPDEGAGEFLDDDGEAGGGFLEDA